VTAPDAPRAVPSVALYAGSFDPVTHGHEDLIARSLGFADRLVVAVAHNPNKSPLFSVEERVGFIRAVCGHLPGVEVVSFSGLLVELARQLGARINVRGLRAVSDFEYEFQMAGMNRQLMPDVETLFLTPSDAYQFVSGTFVREIAMLGGDVGKFVAPPVLQRLQAKKQQRDAQAALPHTGAKGG